LTRATNHGLGRHIQFLDGDARGALLRIATFAAAFTIAASVWSKVSFAIFLLRISSSGCTERTRKAILGIIISLNAVLPVAAATLFLSCSPVEKNWKPEIDGNCWDPRIKVSLATATAG
jgi:hypothetical protein